MAKGQSLDGYMKVQHPALLNPLTFLIHVILLFVTCQTYKNPTMAERFREDGG
jgi:hypothetical protein